MAKVENGRVIFTVEGLRSLRQLRAEVLRRYGRFGSTAVPTGMDVEDFIKKLEAEDAALPVQQFQLDDSAIAGVPSLGRLVLSHKPRPEPVPETETESPRPRAVNRLSGRNLEE